jgi:hypothetical protein
MIFAVCAKFSGSRFFSHSNFGAVKHGDAAFPVHCKSLSPPIVSFRYFVSSPARLSFHRIAGRIALSPLSRSNETTRNSALAQRYAVALYYFPSKFVKCLFPENVY